MPEYRMTPEREAILQRIRRTQTIHTGRPLFPSGEESYLESVWSEEDELRDRYGYLPRFDWVITDEAEGCGEAKGVSTQQEAVSKVLAQWRGIGYSPVGELRYEKTLSVKQGGKDGGADSR